MENRPEMAGKMLPPRIVDPSLYGHNLRPFEDNGEQRRRARVEQFRRSRNRLSFIMAMAHGAVELALRREPRRIRGAVRNDLNRRYGFKVPRSLGM